MQKFLVFKDTDTFKIENTFLFNFVGFFFYI